MFLLQHYVPLIFDPAKRKRESDICKLDPEGMDTLAVSIRLEGRSLLNSYPVVVGGRTKGVLFIIRSDTSESEPKKA